MPQTNYDEVFISLLASVGIFFFIGVFFVFIVLYTQKKKKLHKQSMINAEERNKRQLIQSKLEVEEQSRLYFSRELHDNIGTLSSLIKINLNLMSSEITEEKRTALLTESKDLVKTLITEVKQLSVALNPDRIIKMSLSQAIQLETDRIKKLNLFMVNYSVEGEEWAILPDKQIVLYRICQELLHNILKHARPFKVTVILRFEKNYLRILIEDDGVGFVPETGNSPFSGMGGAGLLNIYSRADLIGGSLFLDTCPGKGTKWYIEVPYTNA